jgi:hypothetical protein
MNGEQQPDGTRRPPPVFAILASASPFICAVVPLYIGMSDSDSGDFSFMIAMGYGFVGAILGILFGAGFAISARLRRERHALSSALITLVATPLSLLMALLIYDLLFI